MTQRIRYIKDPSGAYITSEFIKNEVGSEFRAGYVIGMIGNTAGFIKSVGDDSTNLSFQATSPHKIKIKIKRALTKLGCIFEKESRKPKKE